MIQFQNIPTYDLSNLIEVLKPYQRKIIEKLLISEHQDVEKAAEKWLTMTGLPNIVAFGGVGNPKPFWDNFKNEFYRFFCDDTAYVDEKKVLLIEHHPNIKLLLSSTISSAIGAKIGLAASLITPAVVLMLYLVFKMGIAAYCQTI